MRPVHFRLPPSIRLLGLVHLLLKYPCHAVKTGRPHIIARISGITKINRSSYLGQVHLFGLCLASVITSLLLTNKFGDMKGLFLSSMQLPLLAIQSYLPSPSSSLSAISKSTWELLSKFTDQFVELGRIELPSKIGIARFIQS